MKKIQLKENKTICENRDSVFKYFAWPTVARLPDGTLAVGCSGFRTAHVCPFSKSVILYSRDEGKTWTKPAVVIDTPLDDRDTGITVFKDRVMVTSFNNTYDHQYYVIDNFRKESTYAIVKGYLDGMYPFKDAIYDKYLGSVYKISDDGGYTFGELKKSPVTAPHGGFVLPSGEVLYIGNKLFPWESGLKDNNLYCCKLNENDEFEVISVIENDSENSWHEPFAIALNDKDIIVHIRVHQKDGEQTTYQSESHDGGLSFTKPHAIPGLSHGIPAHIIRHSSGILISVYGNRKENNGQRAMMSKDNGESWDIDYILTDDSESWDHGYPATIELENNDLLTVYYQYNKEVDACEIKQCIWTLPEIN